MLPSSAPCSSFHIRARYGLVRFPENVLIVGCSVFSCWFTFVDRLRLCGWGIEMRFQRLASIPSVSVLILKSVLVRSRPMSVPRGGMSPTRESAGISTARSTGADISIRSVLITIISFTCLILPTTSSYTPNFRGRGDNFVFGLSHSCRVNLSVQG